MSITNIDEFFKYPDIRHEIQSLPTGITVEVRRLSHPDMMVEGPQLTDRRFHRLYPRTKYGERV